MPASNGLEKVAKKHKLRRAVVVTQLVEQSLPTPEVRGSNPVIGENYLNIVYCQLYRKDENKEKEAGIGHLKKE